jgi:hypothetical protein
MITIKTLIFGNIMHNVAIIAASIIIMISNLSMPSLPVTPLPRSAPRWQHLYRLLF